MGRKPAIVEVLTITTPPSVNALFANSKTGRIKSSDYAKWRRLASQELMIQRPKSIPGFVSISLYHATKRTSTGKIRKADCSNFIKAVEDVLVEMRVIEDDSFVRAIFSCWAEGMEAGMTRIVIEPMAEPIHFTTSNLADFTRSPI